METKFYGSQIGSKKTTQESYTGSPMRLLRSDVFSAFGLFLLLPYIAWPLSPRMSGHLCELYPSLANLWCCVLHLILILMQLPFILSIPFWLFFPLWSIIIAVSVFGVVNAGICYLLNGTQMRIPSNPKFASQKGHEHEQWIFLNGVAVGKHWLQSNVDRLALTFGRPVLGVHNKTNGILFDVIQCLIQRNLNYATNDIRTGYQVVKETLYDPTLTKIVFILHSQGGIEGGMIIDWLLQEVPQDLLAKLEVYTFGCAANHFNNPHLHLVSQRAALKHPTTPSITKSNTTVHYHDALPKAASSTDTANGSTVNDTTNPRNSSSSGLPSRTVQSTSGKTIRYIEHYAHTSDFVAQWGVLYYTNLSSTSSSSLSPTSPRYMGRVFERPGRGHQFCQHYLDSMFPMKACPSRSSPAPSASSSFSSAPPKPSFIARIMSKKSTEGTEEADAGGIGNSGFLGADEECNEFMDSVLAVGGHTTTDGTATTKKVKKTTTTNRATDTSTNSRIQSQIKSNNLASSLPSPSPSDPDSDSDSESDSDSDIEDLDERESWELSYLSAHGTPFSPSSVLPSTFSNTKDGKSSSSSTTTTGEAPVLLKGFSPVTTGLNTSFDNGKGFTSSSVGGHREQQALNGANGVATGGPGDNGRCFRVKHLSRLWLYVNGKSPKMDEVDVGIARMSTI